MNKETKFDFFSALNILFLHLMMIYK